MKDRTRHLWTTLLTAIVLLVMGVQGLPVPCQRMADLRAGCETACNACPPSCTCHTHPLAVEPEETCAAHCRPAQREPIAPDFALPVSRPPAALATVFAMVIPRPSQLRTAWIANLASCLPAPPYRPPLV